MNITEYPDIQPPGSPLKVFVNKAVLWVMGRALQSLSHSDPLMRQEVAAWPEGFTMMLVVRPDGSSMAVTRDAKSQLVYRGTHFDAQQDSVVITIKHIDSALPCSPGSWEPILPMPATPCVPGETCRTRFLLCVS